MWRVQSLGLTSRLSAWNRRLSRNAILFLLHHSTHLAGFYPNADWKCLSCSPRWHSRPPASYPWQKVPLPGNVWQLQSKKDGEGIRVHTLSFLRPYTELGASAGVTSNLLTTPKGTGAKKGFWRLYFCGPQDKDPAIHSIPFLRKP